MNSDPFPIDSAEEQASLWAAKLEGSSLSSSDRDLLDLWLNADASHRTLLASYCQFSADLEEQLPLLVATGLTDLPSEGSNKKSRGHPMWWTAGAVFAAAAAVAVVFYVEYPKNSTQLISTAAGQRQTITLSDGTKVELNARTSLRVDSTATARHVQLAEGEAFFMVSKDKTRPFTVETPAGSVRVTGTVFDVRSETTNQLDVTVVEGSVQVRPGESAKNPESEPYLLKHNDALVSEGSGATVHSLSNSELSDTLAWRDGLVVADGLTLTEAIAQFARYHGQGITVTEAASRTRIGGRYNIDDIEGFLTDIQQQYPVKVSHEANGTIRVSLRSEP